MSGDLNKKDDAWWAIYEAKMAAEINELTSDLITTLPNLEPRRVGDKLLNYLLCLIRIARELGHRVFGWFSQVNQEQFCNVILMWATIAQTHLLDQVRLGGLLRPFQDGTYYDFHKGVDLRNISLVYQAIDYIGTFDAWGLENLKKRLDEILSSSNQSQRILRYMSNASPHIHGGSWMILTQARSYLRTCRTFGDFQRSMNPTPSKMDEVVKTHAGKALLDIYHTENASRYRILLNCPERRQVVAKNLYNHHSQRYSNTLHSVVLQQLPRAKRRDVVRECQRFWAQDEITKLERWMLEGLPAVDLARGMFHFSRLCMYPSSRMMSKFLLTAFKTSGLDGDAIIGHMGDSLSSSRTPVKVFEFFSQDGISSTHLHVLGPMLSRENTNIVQQKFNDLTKYGYKHNLWRNYKSFLRYGFNVNVDQLHIKEHLKKMIISFVTKALPQEVKNRAIYLYAHLKSTHQLSELPLTIIFEFDGIHHWYEYARARMEHKRKKSVLQKQKFEERKARKRLMVEAAPTAASVDTDLGSPRKKPRNGLVLNNNEKATLGNYFKQSTVKITEIKDRGMESHIKLEEKEDLPISLHEQTSTGNEAILPPK